MYDGSLLQACGRLPSNYYSNCPNYSKHWPIHKLPTILIFYKYY